MSRGALSLSQASRGRRCGRLYDLCVAFPPLSPHTSVPPVVHGQTASEQRWTPCHTDERAYTTSSLRVAPSRRVCHDVSPIINGHTGAGDSALASLWSHSPPTAGAPHRRDRAHRLRRARLRLRGPLSLYRHTAHLPASEGPRHQAR